MTSSRSKISPQFTDRRVRCKASKLALRKSHRSSFCSSKNLILIQHTDYQLLVFQTHWSLEEWGLCEYVIVHTILGGSLVILWISLGEKPKWLPLKFGYHDVMRTSTIGRWSLTGYNVSTDTTMLESDEKAKSSKLCGFPEWPTYVGNSHSCAGLKSSARQYVCDKSESIDSFVYFLQLLPEQKVECSFAFRILLEAFCSRLLKV